MTAGRVRIFLVAITGLLFSRQVLAAWQGEDLRNLLAQAQQLQSRKDEVARFLVSSGAAVPEATPAAPRPRTHQKSSGRGIVMTVGGTEMLLNALVVAKVVRYNLSCDLPMEIFYYGGDQLDQHLGKIAQGIPDVELVDGNERAYPQHHAVIPIAGYAAKGFSLYFSRFREVLMMDCDSQPLIDPRKLFASQIYREHGNVFWPDFFEVGGPDPWGILPKEESYYLLGLDIPWRNEQPFRGSESGQILFNRARYKDVLEYILLISVHQDIIYKYTWGDKDTFQMAFMLAGKGNDFYQVPHRLRMAMADLETPKAGAAYHRSLGFIQSDLNGQPIFYHRTRHKFKLTTDVAARSMLPTLITEGLAPDVMLKYLYNEAKIQEAHPREPFDAWLAMKAEGVSVASNCSQLQSISARAVALAVERTQNGELLASIGQCNPSNEGPVDDVSPIVAIPADWFGGVVPAALDGAYTCLGELLELYFNAKAEHARLQAATAGQEAGIGEHAAVQPQE